MKNAIPLISNFQSVEHSFSCCVTIECIFRVKKLFQNSINMRISYTFFYTLLTYHSLPHYQILLVHCYGLGCGARFLPFFPSASSLALLEWRKEEFQRRVSYHMWLLQRNVEIVAFIEIMKKKSFKKTWINGKNTWTMRSDRYPCGFLQQQNSAGGE